MQCAGEHWRSSIGAVRRRESQPSGDPLARSNEYALLFDGWLRNRSELARLAGNPPESSAAQIVLSLLLREGVAALDRLRGHYALAFIQANGRCIHLARDPTGQRPLFYRIDAGGLLAASQELAVLDAACRQRVPNKTALAAYFALQAPPAHQCFLMDVQEVLPGESMSIDQRGVHTRPIRSIGPGRAPARRVRDGDLVEAWRDVLARATADMIADADHAGLSLSGGLDSGALAALIGPRAGLQAVDAVSWRLSSLPSADETPWIEATARAAGLPLHLFDADGDWPLAGAASWPVHPDTPLSNPYRWLKERQFRMARELGIDTLLSGNFGDHGYPSERDWLSGALRRRRWRPAISELFWRIRERGVGALRRDPGIRALARQILRRPLPTVAPPWIRKGQCISVTPEAPWPQWAEDCADPARCRALLGLSAGLQAAQESWFSDRHGLIIAHPYRDERVIEFILSVPSDVFWRHGQAKSLTRAMLRGRMPESVRERPKAGSLRPLLHKGIRERERALVEELLFDAPRGWPEFVDEAALRSAWESAEPDDEQDTLLWLCIALEQWLRNLPDA